jgi:hypothetical protein
MMRGTFGQLLRVALTLTPALFHCGGRGCVGVEMICSMECQSGW